MTGIDYYYAGKPRVRGMARYVQALCVHAPESLRRLEPEARAFLGRRFFPYWEQLGLPRAAQRGGVSHLICPYNTAPLRMPAGLDFTLVVHDLIFMAPGYRAKSLVQKIGVRYRRYVLPRVIGRASRVVTVSQHTSTLLQQRFGYPAERIHVIPNTLSNQFARIAAGKSGRSPGYLFTVSGSAANKNLKGLLEAHAVLRREGWQGGLVVVGLTKEEVTHLRAHHAGSAVLEGVDFCCDVSDTELAGLYSDAAVFVFPSLEEGFGIPMLEAMSRRVPLVCSATSCMPEIAGKAGAYFYSDRPEEMAVVIQGLLGSELRRRELVEEGQKRVEAYSETRFHEACQVLWKGTVK